MNAIDGTQARLMELRLSNTIEAPVVAVWKALTEDIGSWWPDEFFVGGAAGERRYELELRPGGRMFESWGDNDGLLWAHVTTVRAPDHLQVQGSTFHAFGGPNIWFATWDLSDADGGCRIDFTEHTLGRVDEETIRDKEAGWGYLFGSALKAYVEGSPLAPFEG